MLFSDKNANMITSLLCLKHLYFQHKCQTSLSQSFPVCTFNLSTGIWTPYSPVLWHFLLIPDMTFSLSFRIFRIHLLFSSGYFTYSFLYLDIFVLGLTTSILPIAAQCFGPLGSLLDPCWQISTFLFSLQHLVDIYLLEMMGYLLIYLSIPD